MKQTTDITHHGKVNRTQGSEVYIVTCELIRTPFSLQYHFRHWINFSIKLRPSESALSMCRGVVKTSPDVMCHHRFWRAHRPNRDKNSEADPAPPASLSLAKLFDYISYSYLQWVSVSLFGHWLIPETKHQGPAIKPHDLAMLSKLSNQDLSSHPSIDFLFPH